MSDTEREPRKAPAHRGPTVQEVTVATVRAMLDHERGRRELAPERPRFRNSEIAELLPSFSGFDDDVEMFLDRVNSVKAIYEVTDSVMTLIVAGKLSGQAKNWFLSKNDYVQMDFDTFCEELITTFRCRPNKITLMRNFEARKWKRNEPFTSYFSDKLRLGNKANTPDSDMVDYIIDGMNNPVLQGQARMQQFTTPGELLRAMKSITNEEQNATTSGQSNRKYTPKPSTSATPASTSGQSGETTRNLSRCYNCDQLGHLSRNCRKPRRNPGS